MVIRGIEGLNMDRDPSEPYDLGGKLGTAIFCGSNAVARYLINENLDSVDAVKPFDAYCSDSRGFPPETLQTLLDYGWDINKSLSPEDDPEDEDPRPGKRLLQYIYDNDQLVRWCLDHGAEAKDPHPFPHVSPPVLDNIAVAGSIATFELLRSKGAELGMRTLHRAVWSTCLTGEPKEFSPRMDMVKHIVLNLGADVNSLDCDHASVGHYGTLLGYAVGANRHADNESEVIRFLIDQGADPFKRDFWGSNAIDTAMNFNRSAYELICHMFSLEVEEGTRNFVPHGKKRE